MAPWQPYIIRTNLLTKCHEDPTINVTLRVLTRQIFMTHNGKQTIDKRKNAPPPDGHVFQPTQTMFKLFHDIIRMNLLPKVLTRKKVPPPGDHFHDDRTINVATRELTRQNTTPPWRPYIIGTNLLTKFHKDRTINKASRVLTRKNAPPPGGHVFQATGTIFELVQDIIGRNLQTKFYDDWKINVASRLKNAPPPGGHVFQPTGINFDSSKIFHEDWTINLASRVLTRHIKKNAPTLGSHVFQANITSFEFIQDIMETNLLTKFHEDWTINVASGELARQMLTPHNARRTTDKMRSQKLTMSTLCLGTDMFFAAQDIIRTNNELKWPPGSHFHEDWTINLTIRKSPRPPVGHVFQSSETNFELVQDIIGTNLLRKLHEDSTINVASTVLTRKIFMTPN
ncbi:hypothetical protein DPMN_148240 [Dreissena polymorpha]|uniref:Uncharacterized protein n=1 Tax=Dreissena polymorpha TaxID=45954 RepID=A0A9D4FF59_DREPO|nr:hypothetical protein DPMN_148240 [Dreissena polymorpha]